MTLLITLKEYIESDEVILMSSDSKVTAGHVTFDAQKIYPIGIKRRNKSVPIAIAGGAGDVALAKQCFRMCERALQDVCINEWEKQTPTYNQFEEAITRIESLMIRKFYELTEMGIEIHCNIVLASVDKNNRASIYKFDSRGISQPLHDNPGFSCIGTGFVTGGNLLLRLMNYEPDLSAVELSTFIIEMVSEIDPAVGPFIGESYYMRYSEEEDRVFLGPMKEKAIKEFKTKIRKRRDIISRIWRLCDGLGEKELLKKIKELESQPRD